MPHRPFTIVFFVAIAAVYGQVTYGQFDDVSHWAAFDAGDHGVGDNPDGYSGAIFDGRYMYFVPFANAGGSNGEVLRYDTSGDFGETSSWTSYTPGSQGIGNDPTGYMGGVFDGRYAYFVPLVNSTGLHGEVLRFDTQSDFSDTSSWEAYDPGEHGVGVDPDGYNGGIFDGRYLYFAPFHNGTENHGEVLRYDTVGSFSDVSSWTTYDPSSQGVGTNPKGYRDAVFDGRYVYFVPGERGSGGIAHGEVLRYDTSAGFTDVSAWSAFDPGANGVGNDPDGFAGGVFDARYVYFVPFHNGSTESGEVLRYDTTLPFADSASWTTYDAAAAGIGDNPKGFAGGAFDGQYVFFAPHYDNISAQDEVLRYDTTGGFSNASSWAAYDPVGAGVGEGDDGRIGAAFDGRHVYFAPYHDFNGHGQVLRFDTFVDCDGNGIDDQCDLDCGPTGERCDVPGCGLATDHNGNGIPDDCDPSIPAVSEWGLAVMMLLVLVAGSVVLARRSRSRG